MGQGVALVKSLVQKSHLVHVWAWKKVNEARKRPFSGTNEFVASSGSQLAKKRYPKQVYPIKIPFMRC
jgi:hypothetical protein